MYTLRLSIPEGQLDKIKRSLNSTVHLAAYDKAVGQSLAKGNRVVIEATPRRSGHLRKRWAEGLKRLGSLRYQLANAAAYAPWVEGGTGLFGPRRRVIVPRKAKFLRFKIEGHWVTVKSVKGMRPVHMLKNSLSRIGSLVETALSDAVRKLWA